MMDKNIYFSGIKSQSYAANKKIIDQKFNLLQKNYKNTNKKIDTLNLTRSMAKQLAAFDTSNINQTTDESLDQIINHQTFSPNTLHELKKLKTLNVMANILANFSELSKIERKIERKIEEKEAKPANYSANKELKDLIKLEKRWNDCNSIINNLNTSLDNMVDNQKTINEEDKTIISKKDFKEYKKFTQKLLNYTAKVTGTKKSTLKKEVKANLTELLNQREWKEIKLDTVIGQNTYTSNLIPAGKIQYMTEDGRAFPLMKGYSGGVGVGFLDTKNTEHATNLWISRLQSKGKNLFSAIRFGVCCPFGITKNQKLLEQGATNKAKEVLTAALLESGKLQQAIDAFEKDMPLPRLNVASISLLTTGLGSGSEEKMQKAQNKAFRQLSDPKKQPVELTILGPDGKEQAVKFNLTAHLLNFPVNFGGVGLFSWITSGRISQFKQNKLVMEAFFGTKDYSNTIGIVDNYQRDIQEDIDNLKSQLDLQPQNQKSLEIQNKINVLNGKNDLIYALKNQAVKIFSTGAHYHNDDIYKLPARMAILASEVGAVPMFNCKSGKDRTAWLDIEIKYLLAYYKEFGGIPKLGVPLNKEETALFNQIVKESGNAEIQSQNTGARGTVGTKHVSGIHKRVGSPEALSKAQGVSTVIKS